MIKTEKKIQEKLLIVQHKPCYICGDASCVVAYFKPYVPKSYGAPKGKQRLFFYSLCFKCFLNPSSQTQIEHKFKKFA